VDISFKRAQGTCIEYRGEVYTSLEYVYFLCQKYVYHGIQEYSISSVHTYINTVLCVPGSKYRILHYF
jgi:hypothetical protein